MDGGTLALWLLALVLLFVAWRRPDVPHRQAVGQAFDQLVRFLPRIAVALLASGFLAVLLPGEVIAALIGEQSGMTGVLIASVVGGFVPGGPIISFPVVVVLYHAGAGVPQLVAFLTAWSAFAFHRVLIYETTMMGWRFSAVRLTSSLILPPLAGALAAAVQAVS